MYRDSEKSHDKNLECLLAACQQKNIKLNKEKSVFKTTDVEFLGHIITNQGLKPDPKKIEAILEIENPTDVTAIRHLQGTVTYLAKFLPKFSTVMELLRRLTHQEQQWEWSDEQEKAMTELKHLVTTAPVLSYYDPAKELIIQCDASSTGLEAVLLQDNHPLAYASRALSDTECGYAQIAKECLAMVFSLQRFHQYTFGRRTIVHTDHKPLETIVKKPLCKAPKRLQGMLLRLLQYDIEFVYKKCKEMYLADMLSRAYFPLDPHHKDCFARINAVQSYQAPKRLQGMLLRLLQYDIEVVYKKCKEMYLADMLSRAYFPLDPHHKDCFARINAVQSYQDTFLLTRLHHRKEVIAL